MEETRCVVVTGGNKGVGFEICRQLALNGIQVVLTARNESRGTEAVEKLNASGIPNVIFHQLDIEDSASVAKLFTFIETRFKKLDILADTKVDLLTGIIEEPYDLGEECLNVNYHGTKRVSEAFIPLLQLSKSPRIVNVTSAYGDLHWFYNEELKQELYDIEKLTEERIDEIIQWFLRDFKAGKLRENGWPLPYSAYKVSKAVVNAYTRLVARRFRNIVVNAVHPGRVATDMTCHTGILTAEEGAKAPVMVALLPDDGPSGAYFDKMELAPFTLTARPI